ncbi:MAG: pyridoxamine 5'-phosphate oxidase [Actinomycetota bacterium]
MDLARMRQEYETIGLSEADVLADPIEQFDRWFNEAVAAEVYEPNAMVISTVDGGGQPWSRHVLLKGVTDGAFDFYTNYDSNKSAELDTNPNIAVTFGWLPLHRQVNIGGTVARVPAEESDAYWAVRTRGSQIGGWASAQSRELVDRAQLVANVERMEARFPGDVPRPPHWGGWRITPHTIEFWQGRQNRLHDRLRFHRDPSGDWQLVRLSP